MRSISKNMGKIKIPKVQNISLWITNLTTTIETRKYKILTLLKSLLLIDIVKYNQNFDIEQKVSPDENFLNLYP